MADIVRQTETRDIRGLRDARRFVLCALVLALGACSVAPPQPTQQQPSPPAAADSSLPGREMGNEIVMYAFGLLDVGYRFGGRNPESGLDCSGMVSHIFEQVTGLQLPHNAAQIARMTRPIARDELQPGDLVFFNTRNRPFSHVGIYVGDDRFVHAPSRNGRVRVNSLGDRYYASRFEAARAVLAD